MRGRISSLSEQWMTASTVFAWRSPDDWRGPAVEAMVGALVTQDGIADAAGGLGADRAARGLGLRDSLDDLAVLFSIATQSQPPFEVTRTFVDQWNEVSTASLLNRGTTDALTGLGTEEYLLARVREIYAEARATGEAVGKTWCLVRVDSGDPAGWRRVVRQITIAREVSNVLDRGQSNAVLGSGLFVSLCRTGDLDENIVRLRVRLRHLDDLDSVTVSTTTLPEDLDATVALVRSL
jgi:hypothetical protein